MLDEPPSHGPGFELTEHTGDLGARARGPRREDVFAQAALGMLALVCDPATVTGRERYGVEVEEAEADCARTTVEMVPGETGVYLFLWAIERSVPSHDEWMNTHPVRAGSARPHGRQSPART